MTEPRPPLDEAASPIVSEPRRRSVGQIVFAVILIGFGVAWLIAATDLIDVPWRAMFAGALILIGAALVASSTRERHGGLVVTGIILTVMLGLLSTGEGILDLPVSGGIGQRSYQPLTPATLATEYRLGIGEIVVDLSEVPLPDGETRVETSVTMGSLIVVVPDDVPVRVDAHVTAGEVTVFGSTFSGTSISQTVQDPGYAEAPVRLDLEAAAGLGEVVVRR
jgi:hypothetical protein